MLKKSLISLVIRFATLLLRLFFVLYFAKELTTYDLGIWGVFTSTIILSTFVVGLEFYQYSTREILGISNPVKVLLNQGLLYIFCYIVILPVTSLVFLFGFLPMDLFIIFVLIAISEHLSQELFRVFITTSSPILANVLLFIRNGSWIIYIVLLHFLDKKVTSIQTILEYWLFGSLLSVLIGGFFLVRKYNLLSKILTQKTDKKWILNGIRVLTYFFGTSLFLKGIEFSDRYFLKYFHTENEVGVYTFYFSISNVVSVFVFTGIISLIAPIAIKSFQQNDFEKYKKSMRAMMLYSILGIIFVSSIIFIGVDFLVDFIGKEVFYGKKDLLLLMIGSVSMFLIGIIPQYELFVRKKDKVLFLINIPPLILCLTINYFLVPSLSYYGAAIATFLSYLFLTSLKFFFARRFRSDLISE